MTEEHSRSKFSVYLIYPLIFIYLAFQFFPILSSAFVFDEFWFFHIGIYLADSFRNEGFFKTLFSYGNYLGYGSIYWIIQGIFHYFFVGPAALRLFYFGLIAMIPVLFVLIGRKIDSTYIPVALLFWFITPVAWWYGKITGPEILSMVLLVLGIYLILQEQNFSKKLIAGTIILGFSLGIKLNALPILFFIYGIRFAEMINPVNAGRMAREILKISALLLTGFILANPFLPFKPYVFFENIPKVHGNYSLEFLGYILQNSAWEWDSVYIGGLVNWTLGSLGVILFLVLLSLARLPLSWYLGTILATVGMTLLILGNSAYHGWYWFPLTILIPILILKIRERTLKINVLLFLTLLTGAYSALPIIQKGYQTKLEHVSILRSREKISKSILSHMDNGYSTDLIVDFSEIGLNIDYSLIYKKQPEILANYGAFLWIESGYKKEKIKNQVFLLVGGRLKEHNKFSNFRNYMNNEILMNRHNDLVAEMCVTSNEIELWRLYPRPGNKVTKTGL